MSVEQPTINNVAVSEDSSSPSPKLSLPALVDSQTSETCPNDIESVLNQFGYKYLGRLSDTLQGELILAETIISNYHKTVRPVAIKRTSKHLYNNKIMRQDDGTNFVVDEDILNESLILYRSTVTNRCPGNYLAQFIECFHSETDYYLAMEYISSKTTLREFVEKAHDYISKGLLDKKEWVRIVKFITWQLVVTLHYLHTTMKVAHLDLTMVCGIGDWYFLYTICVITVMSTDFLLSILFIHQSLIFQDNIMVQNGDFVFTDNEIKVNRGVNIKLIDFGMATAFVEDQICNKQHSAFSLTEKAPEIFHDETYSAPKVEDLSLFQNDKLYNDFQLTLYIQADIWSLGLLLFQMMFHCTPYSKQMESDSRYCWLARGKMVEVIRRKNPSSMPVTVKLVKFLRDTLQFTEKKRVDISAVLSHPYLQSYYQRYKADFEKNTSPSPKEESGEKGEHKDGQ